VIAARPRIVILDFVAERPQSCSSFLSNMLASIPCQTQLIRKLEEVLTVSCGHTRLSLSLVERQL
jgi:hypothetical protein